ncbi:hypothetical protein [Bacillus sp. P14.5]|uniref:hypothetical protein n=1 Tax=Bacillus sp. P14.5 TaxID=1983400 RepID=UPI000DEA554F|nr:hypothetical protein [Bacillus sp. P14.5]
MQPEPASGYMELAKPRIDAVRMVTRVHRFSETKNRQSEWSSDSTDLVKLKIDVFSSAGRRHQAYEITNDIEDRPQSFKRKMFHMKRQYLKQ